MFRLATRSALSALLLLTAAVLLHAQTAFTPLCDMDQSSAATNTGNRLRRSTLAGSLLFMVVDQGGVTRLRSTTGAGVLAINDAVRAYGPTTVNGMAYFAGDNGVNGTQPWATNGSSMTMLTTIPLTNGYMSSLYPMAGANGITYLGAISVQTGGRNIRGMNAYLYRTNGTAAGTTLLKQWSSSEPTAGCSNLLPLNNQTSVFQVWYGYSASKQGVYKTDGTAKGTVAIKSMLIGGNSLVATANGTPYYYFTGDNGSTGMELWRTNGTSAGTVCVTDLVPGTASSSPASATLCGGKIYFAATTPTTGTELYCHDPATNQTSLVYDIFSGSGSSAPRWLTENNGLLYFSATTESNGRELYEFDPNALISSSNPRLIEIWSGPGNGDPLYGYTGSMNDSDNPHFVRFGSYLYFAANDGSGYKLWRTNGTITEMVPGFDLTGATNPNCPTVLGSTLFYVAYTAGPGYQLWKYTPGTVPRRVGSEDMPSVCTLSENHPNPFTETTTLDFRLTTDGPVRLAAYDMLGREVAVLAEGAMQAGTHSAVFRAASLPSGSYLVRLTAGGEVRTRIVRLLR